MIHGAKGAAGLNIEIRTIRKDMDTTDRLIGAHPTTPSPEILEGAL